MSKALVVQLGNAIAVAAWEAFFAERPYYAVTEAEGGEGLDALYENPETEVSFAFRWRAGIATFELAFAPPRPFALEAEAEVAAFALKFNVPWPAGELVRRWEAGRTRSRSTGGAIPAALVEQVWRWNRGRRALAASLELVVPRIGFAKVGTQLKTFVEWTAELASALPKVDLVWVEQPGDERLVRVAKLAKALDVFPTGAEEDSELGFWRVGEAGPPEEVLAVVAKLPKGKAPVRVAFAQVKEK